MVILIVMNSKNKTLWLILSGCLTGLINGFFGGGGGMVVVPMLSYLLSFPVKQSHATALAVILPVTIISSCVYIFKGKINWIVAAVLGVGVLAGGILGAKLLNKIKTKSITIIFSVIMAVAGIKMLFF